MARITVGSGSLVPRRGPLALPLAAAALVALLGPGCASPDLGQSPFFCNAGTPKCPSGYTCVAGQTRICLQQGAAAPASYPAANVAMKGFCGAGNDPCGAGYRCATVAANFCLTEGGNAPTADAGTTDRGGKPADGKPPQKDSRPGDKGVTPPKDGKPPQQDQGPPPAMELVITEIMANPSAVWDSYGEWIELYNPTSKQLNINGWTLRDDGQDKHVIAHSGPLYVPARGYLVLGMNANKVLNGGVNVAYAYQNFFLANSADEVYLVNAKGQTMAVVRYDKSKGFPIVDGASMSLRLPNLDGKVGANWCEESGPWAGSQGDKGSPLANPKCK